MAFPNDLWIFLMSFLFTSSPIAENPFLLIHEADPQYHCFCTCRPFVRPHFSKQNKFQAKTMFSTSETVGLAEWIIAENTFFIIPFLFTT